ncbi:PIN-like domain-containing protein [Flavobacterium sp. T12S277]|uniref:PIN-like domain-containing protein n=1 Tax=Flavobacterium sp. T12S277 TaxID=3402752 RepID=UPI003AE6BC5B
MKINKDFYFNPFAKLTVAISNSALRKYANNFDSCSKLEGELPILLDTNILLGYYGMSQTEKEKLVEFLDKLKDRIFLTKQIEEEFLRNRLTVIKKDFFGPLNKISEDYLKVKGDIEGLLKNFRDNKKKILSQDYPDLFNKLQEIEEEVKATLNDDTFIKQIKDRVEETTSNNKNIALIDGLLEKVSKFKITEALEEEEVNFLTEEYEKQVTAYKNEKEVSRWKIALPGCGETKEDAIGDYIIYHEALKYMKEHNTSIIFLTNDVTKGDWLQFDKNPHNHYIEQTYRLTEEIFYIIHAEKTLTEISFENIHNSTNEILYNAQKEISEVIKEFESTIISIDTVKGFGFIYTNDGNIFFSHADFDGDFRSLNINDVVKFQIGTNFNGKLKATAVQLIKYDFNDPNMQTFKSTISHINQFRGIGFISHQPENLYFHQQFLENKDDFALLEIGNEVEYLIGFNDEGEKIARKVRHTIN